MKRIFDILFSFVFLIILFPLFLIISLVIIIDSRGGIIYKQLRVGKNGKDFKLLKFRTMKPDSDKNGLLTIGSKDNRITKTGYWLRKYKLDELPQLINIILGDMSVVGPRPEVRKYVSLYDAEQQKILTVKPGLTDYASIEFINESEILSESDNPEWLYIHKVMPAKLNLNQKYIDNQSFSTDLMIIIKTIKKILAP